MTEHAGLDHLNTIRDTRVVESALAWLADPT